MPPSCVKSGVDYSKIPYKTIHYDWDSCYLRGCSYVKGECLDYALQEFKMAIKDRPHDTGLVMAYGMHQMGQFPSRELEIMGYFPHRELGILYYSKGHIKEAIEELETSLMDCPSSKAMFYINLARKKWLLENDLDHDLPSLHISQPPSHFFVTNQPTITLQGLAEDDHYISTLTVNGEPIFIELASKSVPFSHNLILQTGQNQIVIESGDLVGLSASETLEIIVDTMGPVINMAQPQIRQPVDGRIFIQGIVLDDSGLDTLSIDGKPVEIEGGIISEFSRWVDVPKDAKRLTLVAADIAGNKTIGTIDLFHENNIRRSFGMNMDKTGKAWISASGLSMDHSPAASREPVVRLASLFPFIPAVSHEESIPESLCDAEAAFPDPFFDFLDPPSMTIYDQIPLHGKILYKTPIAAINIYVNKRPFHSLSYDSSLLSKIRGWLFEKALNYLFWGWTIKLDPGPNEITIEVINGDGAKERKTYNVLKKEEEVLDQRHRLGILILPTEGISSPNLNLQSSNRYAFKELTSAFVTQKRFNPVDREKLDKILQELRLSESALFNQSMALEIGGHLPADVMCASYIVETEDSVELKAFITDVETSQYVCAKDVYLMTHTMRDIHETISTAAKILAMKTRDEFPLIKGDVLEKQQGKILVTLGKKDKIREGTKLIVYREENGEILFLTQAKIEKLLDISSSMAWLYDTDNAMIVEGDKVITK